MEEIKQRFTKWYVNRGYTFGFKTCDPFRACWHCPWWVRPLLFLFSPSVYYQEMGKSFAEGLTYGLNETKTGENRKGVFECFHCGERAVIWDGDFSFEDYQMDGEGIIHECHCSNCGAMITYYIPLGDNNDNQGEKSKIDPNKESGA